jgi:hypothetical protein
MALVNSTVNADPGYFDCSQKYLTINIRISIKVLIFLYALPK